LKAKKGKPSTFEKMDPRPIFYQLNQGLEEGWSPRYREKVERKVWSFKAHLLGKVGNEEKQGGKLKTRDQDEK